VTSVASPGGDPEERERMTTHLVYFCCEFLAGTMATNRHATHPGVMYLGPSVEQCFQQVRLSYIARGVSPIRLYLQAGVLCLRPITQVYRPPWPDGATSQASTSCELRIISEGILFPGVRQTQ